MKFAIGLLALFLCISEAFNIERRPSSYLTSQLLNSAISKSMEDGKVKKYCLNVTLWVKPERREEFLQCIKQNEIGTLTNEPLAISYTWGENVKEKNKFHFQEQFEGEEGFIAHTKSPHFAVWQNFADEGESPFSQPPDVQFFESF